MPWFTDLLDAFGSRSKPPAPQPGQARRTVLALLATGPRSVAQIRAGLASQQMRPTASALADLLNAMVRAGVIEGLRSTRDRSAFRITPKGLAELRPVPPPDPEPVPDPPVPVPDPAIPAVAAELLRQHNDRHQQIGIPLLVWDAKIQAAAQGHADDMAAHRNMSHTGSDGSDVSQRVQRAKYNRWHVGENIAAGYATISAAFAGWVNSPPHLANIDSENFVHFGGAMARAANGVTFFACVFASPALSRSVGITMAELPEPVCPVWRESEGRI